MDYEVIYKTNLDRFESSPIQVFDAMVQLSRVELYEGLQKRVKKLLVRCILKIGGTIEKHDDCDDENVENLAKDALDHHILLKNRQVVAACYIRLLVEEGCKWASLPPWRPKVMAFLDEILDPAIYREWKITAEQAHESVAQLAEGAREQEKALKEIMASLTSLEMFAQHRTKMMPCLNNKPGQSLFIPFLPEHFISTLSETYKVVERYWGQRDDVNVLDSYGYARDEINRCQDVLIEFDTVYSKLFVSELLARLLSLIQDDFSKNKAAQPTKVQAEARNKKYPLHFAGDSINLGVVVKNMGPGYAHQIQLTVICTDNVLEFPNPDVEIGRLPPSSSQLVEIPAKVIESKAEISVQAQVVWDNFDRTKHSFDFDIVVRAQRSDIDWIALRQSDPYSLEPVANEHELIGRKDVLNRLLASTKAANVGSSIIHGQKRVGKTSIAKTLQSHLEGLGYITVYLEAGDYVMSTASSTLARLGIKTCRHILDVESRVRHIKIPDFSQALSPLTDFLDDVKQIVPERRIVILLDEFDELPSELYVRGTWGDTFFLTLRSITSRPDIGFVLVGGEKMAHIMDYQGDQLNKWAIVQVDYFTRETDWSDYRELVQRPVQDLLEFTDDALESLHEKTAGNPYFTKLICQYVFRDALSKRDCYITRHEIARAAARANQETEKNTFQHFWEDGIIELGEKATEKSIRRRKVLIATSDTLQKDTPSFGKAIAAHPIVRGLPTLEADLREFVTRKVLTGNISGNLPDQSFDFKVKFFHDWLRSRGVQDVISTFSDLDAAMRERQHEEQIRVQPAEIQDVIKNWGLYRGQSISDEKVRAWLDQFTKMPEQRLMFNVLRGVHYYSNLYMRKKMLEAHDIVTRGMALIREYRQQKRSDILVSYIDAVGKSGASLARLYAEETRIYLENVVEKDSLLATLNKKENIRAVVFIDDFVGTGTQASENLASISKTLESVIGAANVRVFFIAVVAHSQGYRRVKDFAETLRVPIEIRACEIIDERGELFGERSSIFQDASERENAQKVAIEYGKVLVRDNPLGYGDLGIAVVFEHGCPNDSLPILWAESSDPRWMPLFRRH